ncbi:MAG: sigma-70 family RNA polymerase sigma factor [Ruminococcus sp.]|nr:sigma-70 family RNA polymerase sigma factor [Ruminococcus sp.]
MTAHEERVLSWLRRAFHAEKKAKTLEMLAERCREKAQRLARNSITTGRNDSCENSTEKALAKLADMERAAEEQRAEAVMLADEIRKAVSSLHDDALETVLIHRFVLFHTVEQTAELLGCSAKTVKRKTLTAISKMSLNVPFIL